MSSLPSVVPASGAIALLSRLRSPRLCQAGAELFLRAYLQILCSRARVYGVSKIKAPRSQRRM